MSRLCHVCGTPFDRAGAVRVTWEDMPSPSLNGMTVRAHARCIRLKATPAGAEVALPERISDPVAEPTLTTVDAAEEGWRAACRECGGIAVKDEREDAEMIAAIHLARRHSGVAA